MEPSQPTRAANDQTFMQRALKLAVESIGLASPIRR